MARRGRRGRPLPPGAAGATPSVVDVVVAGPPGRQPRANVRRVAPRRVPGDPAGGLDKDALRAEVPDEPRGRQLDELGGDLAGRRRPRVVALLLFWGPGGVWGQVPGPGAVWTPGALVLVLLLLLRVRPEVGIDAFLVRRVGEEPRAWGI